MSIDIGYTGGWRLPGIDSQLQTTEGLIWWGRYEAQVVIPTLLDANTVDAGNSITDLLRPGLLLGLNTSTLKWSNWNPSASNGTEFCAGALLYDQKMKAGGTAKDRWFGYVIVRGLLKSGSLIIPGNASAGIAGDKYEFQVRQGLTGTGHFQLDDTVYGNNKDVPFAGYSRHILSSAVQVGNAYTLTLADHDTLFIVDSAAGGETLFTLPAVTACNGFRAGFYSISNSGMKIIAPAGKLVAYNNAAATSIEIATNNQSIGAYIEIIGAFTTQTAGVVSTPKYLAIPHLPNTGMTISIA